jgi:hypothetical protein
VIGAAQAALTGQVTKATAETIGLHDPAGSAIVNGFTDRFGSSGQGKRCDHGPHVHNPRPRK